MSCQFQVTYDKNIDQYTIFSDTTKVAWLRLSIPAWGTSSGLIGLEGEEEYVVRSKKTSVTSRVFELCFENRVLFTAWQDSTFRNYVCCRSEGKLYALNKALPYIGRRFDILIDSEKVGRIDPKDLLSNESRFTLPTEVPFLLGGFLVWIATCFWLEDGE